jgi:hypothetical protein
MSSPVWSQWDCAPECAGGELQFFSATNNSLNGSIPIGLANCDTLLRLMLQHNQLLGEVPKGLWTGQLIWLLLRNNRFTWSLPAIIPRTLCRLDIGNDHFVGRIPSAGFKFAEFTANNNQFSGEIPANLAYDMPQLQKINLANNKLSGVIS